MSNLLINTDDDEGDEKEEKVPFHESSTPIKRKTEPTVEFEEVITTYETYAAMAVELQKKIDEESNEDVTAPTFDFQSLLKTTIAHDDTVCTGMSSKIVTFSLLLNEEHHFQE